MGVAGISGLINSQPRMQHQLFIDDAIHNTICIILNFQDLQYTTFCYFIIITWLLEALEIEEYEKCMLKLESVRGQISELL